MTSKIKYTISIALSLIKFRLSFMVSLSAVIGYILGRHNHIISLFAVFFGVLLLAGGSSAINQYQERKLDAMMKRTSKRPIPSGKIKAGTALSVAIAFAAIGFLLLLYTGIIPAFLGLLNLMIYNLAYTPLKTKSPLSILPGALVGAIPPVIGWTAGGGALFHPHIIFIAIFMFSWQLPHFWLLLIVYGQEYEKAGFSSISKFFTQDQIKYLVFIWTLITSAFIFLFPFFRFHLSPILIILLALVNILFIFLFYRLIFGNPDKSGIRKAFMAINSFMMLVLIIFILNLLV
jgi:heme o synthase